MHDHYSNAQRIQAHWQTDREAPNQPQGSLSDDQARSGAVNDGGPDARSQEQADLQDLQQTLRDDQDHNRNQQFLPTQMVNFQDSPQQNGRQGSAELNLIRRIQEEAKEAARLVRTGAQDSANDASGGAVANATTVRLTSSELRDQSLNDESLSGVRERLQSQ